VVDTLEGLDLHYPVVDGENLRELLEARAELVGDGKAAKNQKKKH
jgi:hypothetical protein